MGEDKALKPLGDIPMVKRILNELQNVFETVWLVGKSMESYQSLSAETVQDKLEGEGPLIGLHAGLSATSDKWCYLAACDQPMLTSPFLRWLIDRYRGEDALVPFMDGRWQPLHAIYRKSLLDPLERFHKSGGVSMKGFLSDINPRTLEASDIPEAFHSVFTNVNTPEEFRVAQKRLAP